MWYNVLFLYYRIPEKLMLSTISERGVDIDRDSPPLSNISHFEPPRCSSALSFYNNDHHDISLMMNTFIRLDYYVFYNIDSSHWQCLNFVNVLVQLFFSDKFGELLQQSEQKLLEQTKQIIEKKLDDTLREMRSIVVPPLTSQLHKCSQLTSASQASTCASV